MNEQLRDIIGKAAYTVWKGEAYVDRGYVTTWEELDEREKQRWMSVGEKVVEAFIQPIMPTLVNLTKSLIGLNQDQQDAIRHIVRVATGKELEEH